MQPKFSIVICAGGSSQRFRAAGGQSSKLFVEWNSKPLFIHSLNSFRPHPPEELALVIPEEEIGLYRDILASEDFNFPIKLVSGGRRRQDSVRNGLFALSPCEFVGIHDAARPFLSSELLKDLLENLAEKSALIPVLEVFDTIKEVDANGKVLRSLDRKHLARVQTPQFFPYPKIIEVHRHYADSPREFTDDSMMWEDFGLEVWTRPGDYKNMKVTRPEDLENLEVR